MAPHVLANPQRCPSQVNDPNFCTANLASYRYMTEEFQARALTWVDGLAALQQSGKDNFYLPPGSDQDHPNADAHQLWAEVLRPVVLQAVRPVAPAAVNGAPR